MISSFQIVPKSIWSKQPIECICDECEKKFIRRFDLVSQKKEHYCIDCSNNKKSLLMKGKKRPQEVVEKVSESRKNSLCYIRSVTLFCHYCHNEFKVPYAKRDRKFCSIECSDVGQFRKIGENKNISKCSICLKEFSHYGSRVVCSRECLSELLSKVRIGSGNPSWKEEFDKQICKNCGKEFEFSRVGLHVDQIRTFCSMKCSSNFNKGSNCYNYLGLEKKYPEIFNEELKYKIRKRDNNCCILCGISEENNERTLSVHHIDYEKSNCDEKNLITLCESCHCSTNTNRGFWQFLFNSILGGSYIVKKGWGCEIHITNNDKYCLKYLIFFKGKKFSDHYHCLKHETWQCIFGELDVYIEDAICEKFILNPGDVLEIKPEVKHQLYAKKNSILVEVSTQDFKEDSYRIEKGD